MLYRWVLALDPSHADALHLLGVIAHQIGRSNIAVEWICRAIARNAQAAAFYSNLGLVFHEQHNLEDAAKSYRGALALEPDLATAYNNLGNALRGLDAFDAAANCYRWSLALNSNYFEACNNLGAALHAQNRLAATRLAYHQSLAIHPPYAQAYNNLANLLIERGELKEAEASYRRALILKPDFIDAKTNFAKLLWNSGNRGMAISQFASQPNLTEKFAAYDQGDGVALQESIVFRLINSWIAERYHEIPETLPIAQNFNFSLKKHHQKRVRFLTGYMRYISDLYNFHTIHREIYHNNNLDRLFSVGDSHVLSLNGIYFNFLDKQRRGEARLITGIKMWHVGQSQENYHRACLREQINKIPTGSDLLFCIGEIDCRRDEGLWPFYKKTGGTLDDIVAKTVEGYLRNLAAIVSVNNPASVTIQGIPAPVYPTPSNPIFDDAGDFLAMISTTNRILERNALAIGWNFLDVYSATCGDRGASHHRWHIDTIHLKPDFYCHADQWMKRAGAIAPM